MHLHLPENNLPVVLMSVGVSRNDLSLVALSHELETMLFQGEDSGKAFVGLFIERYGFDTITEKTDDRGRSPHGCCFSIFIAVESELKS